MSLLTAYDDTAIQLPLIYIENSLRKMIFSTHKGLMSLI